jgi:hypothetical protein
MMATAGRHATRIPSATTAIATDPPSRPSTATSVSHGATTQAEEPKEIWSALLKSVSSHKSIPSRNLLVMGTLPQNNRLTNEGGGTTGTSEFVDGLRLAARQIAGGKDSSAKHKRKRSGLPPLEGTLALGYTYIDILDEENDGMPSHHFGDET